MVLALNSQTRVIADTSKASIELDKRNTQMSINYLQKIQSSTTQLLASINSNVGTMTKSMGDILGKHASVSMKYYDDSMAIFKSINDSIKILADRASAVGDGSKVSVKDKPYENVLDTVINARGSLNLSEYMKLVGKQANRAIDNNIFTSSIKNVVSQTDVLKMMAANPLKIVSDTVIKQFIPAYLKQTAQGFDDMLRETMTGMLYKVRGLKFSKAGNPLFSTISDIFGIGNAMKTDIDRSNYNKGAVAWDGISHRTLNDVIPAYLRQIAAAVTGSQESVFDYNKGTWRTMKDLRDDEQREYNRRLLGDHSSTLSDFKEYVSSSYQLTNSKQSERISKQMEKFLMGLNKSDGMRNFRRVTHSDGTVTDDIADILGKSSDDPVVRMIRGFFEGSNRSYTTNVFGTQTLSNRAKMDKFVRSLEESPILHNNHLTDKNLKFDTTTKYNPDGTVAKGSGIFNVQDKFGYTQSDYLRNILKTLTNGIKVFNMGTGTSVGDFVDPNAKIIRGLKDSSSKFDEESARMRFKINGVDYSDSDIRRGMRRGRHVVNVDGFSDSMTVTSDQATSLRRRQVATEAAKEQENSQSMLAKMGLISGSGNLNKLINKFNEYLEKPSKVLTDIFKKSENFLFNLIFEGGESNPGGSFIKRAFDGMKVQFRKFSDFMDKKILQPLYESMFGEEGFINKFKQTQLGQDITKGIKSTVDYLLGTKDEDGNRQGGMFSAAANEVKDSFRYVGQLISGKEYTDSKGQTHPAIENSIWANIKDIGNQASRGIKEMFGMDPDAPMFQSSGKHNNVILDGIDSFWVTLKARTSDFMDSVFGPPTDDNKRRQQVSQFADDMKKGLPKIAAYATIGGVGAGLFGGSVGFISSLFLPGGLFTGALMGSAIGMVTQSEQLKTFLFGKEDENGNRVGNIITRETMDFFQDNKKGLLIGGGLGWLKSAGLLGFMPAWFLPGGPIGGALAGAAVSMVTKTDSFQRLMFGETDENGNHNGKGLLKNFRGTFGDNAFIDAGLGAGVGLLGSFFLPGGPITGALIGAASGIVLQTEQFKSFMFGKPDENGRREGGFTGFVNEKLLQPMGTALMSAQGQILYFIKDKMSLPLIQAMAPFKAEIGFIKERIFDRFTAMKDSIVKTFEEKVSKPIGDFVQDKFLKPLGSLFTKLFSVLGGAIGWVISRPFNAIGTVGNYLYGKHQRQGVRAYRGEQREYMRGGSLEEREARKASGGRLGIFGEYDAEGNRIGKGRAGRFITGFGNYVTASRKDEARFHDRGAWYNRNGEYTKSKEDFKFESDREFYNNRLKVAERKGVDVRKLLGKRFLRRYPNFEDIFGTSVVDLRAGNRGSRTRVHSPQSETSDNLLSTFQDAVSSSDNNTSLTESSSTNLSTESPNGTSISTDGEVSSSTSQSSNKKKRRNRNQNRAQNRRQSQQNDTTQSLSNNTYVSEYDDMSDLRRNRKSMTQSDRDGVLFKLLKYTKEISSEVKGQLDGVGSNVYKIRLLTQKSQGVSDDDLSGSANRDRLGLFGKFKRAMRHPLDSIREAFMTPFDKIKEFKALISEKFNHLKAAIGQGLDTILGGAMWLGGSIINKLNDGRIFLFGGKDKDGNHTQGIISKGFNLVVNSFKHVFVDTAKGIKHVLIGTVDENGNRKGGWLLKGLNLIKDSFAHVFGDIGSGILNFFLGKKDSEGRRRGSVLIGTLGIIKDAIVDSFLGVATAVNTLLFGNGDKPGLLSKEGMLNKSLMFIGKSFVHVIGDTVKGMMSFAKWVFGGKDKEGNYKSGIIARGAKFVGNSFKNVGSGIWDGLVSAGNKAYNFGANALDRISARRESGGFVRKVYVIGGWLDGIRSTTSNMLPSSNLDSSLPTVRNYNQSPTGGDHAATLDGQLDLDDVFDGSRTTTSVSVDTAESLAALNIMDQRREEREKEEEEQTKIEEDRQEVVGNGGLSWWQKIFRSKDSSPDQDYQARMILGQQEMNNTLGNHVMDWSSIFSKKGLITAGLILAAPLILKAVKWLIETDVFDKIANGIVDMYNGVSSFINSDLIKGMRKFFLGDDADEDGDGEKDDPGFIDNVVSTITSPYNQYLESVTPNSSTFESDPQEWFKSNNVFKDDEKAFINMYGFNFAQEKRRQEMNKQFGINIPAEDFKTILAVEDSQKDISVSIDDTTISDEKYKAIWGITRAENEDRLKIAKSVSGIFAVGGFNGAKKNLTPAAYKIIFKDHGLTSPTWKQIQNTKEYNPYRSREYSSGLPLDRRLKKERDALPSVNDLTSMDLGTTTMHTSSSGRSHGGSSGSFDIADKGDSSQTPTNGTAIIRNGGVYFSQNDNSWGRKNYVNAGGTIASSGCGPTSLAMVLSTITGQYITPDQVAEQSTSLGFACSAGTSWGAMTKIPELAGISNTLIKGSAGYDGDRIGIGNDKYNQVKQLLSSGVPMILSGKRLSSTNINDSPFTTGGHFVVAMGMSGDKIIINDPRGEKYSKAYSFDTVMSEARAVWAYPSYNGQQVQFSTGYANTDGTTISGGNALENLLGGFTNAFINPINKYLYGESFNETSPQSYASGYTYQNGSLVPTTVRDAISLKITEMLRKSESGNNYAIAKNDFSSSTGKAISPSIGIMQWRGSYAKELMNRIFNSSQQMKANTDAQYFANKVNWNDDTPWSDAQLKRFQNFMSSNASIINPIQDNYANQYVDERLTSMLYKYGLDSGVISDPRAAVFLGEISQTGPANIQKFLQRKYNGNNGYNKNKQLGTTELDNVYKQLISPGNSYYGDHINIYKSRLDRSYNELKNWSPNIQAGMGDGSVQYGSDLINYDKYNKLTSHSITANAINEVTSRDGYIHSIISKLGEIVNELRGTNQGINKFNDKDFNVNLPESSNYYNTNNNNIVSSNGKVITSTSSKKSSKVSRELDDDQIKLARQIAAGFSG